MAKMFYTMDETKVALGKNEEEIKQFAREGRLREFRDGPRLMFKADQVETLKSELGGGGDQVDLAAGTDSGAPIGLVDSRVPSLLPAAYGQALQQPPIAGGAGLFVMPAQLSDRVWGCYLLDADAQTLSCYQYWPGEKNLRLCAARTIRYDHLLKNFNTDPDPDFVRGMLEREINGIRTEKSPTTAPTRD